MHQPMLNHNRCNNPNLILSLAKPFITVLLIANLLVSCTPTPDSLGKDLFPDDDFLSARTDTTFQLSVFTEKNDSLPARTITEVILGSIYDPVFGRTKSSYVTQLALGSLSYNLSSKPRVDSAFLTLTPLGRYGDQPITVTVQELEDSLTLGTVYNSLAPFNLRLKPTILGMANHSGNSTLKIPISTSWAQQLVERLDSTALSSQIDFLNEFKGIYITTNELPNYGNGMYYFDLTEFSGSVELFHNDSVILKLFLNELLVTVRDGANMVNRGYNIFEHDHSAASPALRIQNLNDSTVQDSVFYVQGLGGVRGVVRLDGIVEWAKRMPIAIHRAELRIHPDDNPNLPKDSLVNSLLVYTQQGDVYKSIADQGNGMDGKYYKNKGYYSINITLHLQQLLSSGGMENNTILIDPTSFMRANRVVLGSPKHKTRPMQLIITYTEL